MHIFYISATTGNAAVQSNLWGDNCVAALRGLGAKVTEFQGDLTETFKYLDTRNREHVKYIAKNRPVLSAEIVRQVKAAHADDPVDVFFGGLYDACISTEAVQEIKALGIVTVNFYLNASYQLHLVETISPVYDWCLTVERFRMDDYRALGARPEYCQMAANPAVYRHYDGPYEFDVAFVGQRYGQRPEYIAAIADAGCDVHVWGPLWIPEPPIPEPTPKRIARRLLKLFTASGVDAVKRRVGLAPAVVAADPIAASARVHVGPPLSDDDMIRLYSRAKINLGFGGCGETHLDGTKICQVKLRDFEVPMSGGFYLVEHCNELAEFYEFGREVETFSSCDELVDKAKYYLAHDNEREKIRIAGYERCQRDHTWENRFRDAFRGMGLAI
ncbi:MAG TPA: glycosyltransferase [Capsulimonadaceae bacterium]|jgi:hypothetical protein